MLDAMMRRAQQRRVVGRGAERLLEIGRCARLDVPWARCRTARGVRESFQRAVLDPVLAYYTRRRISGREHFAGLEPPVVFVANHSSHIDTPIILRALPWKWRHRTAVAAAADYFYRDRRVARLVSLIFNTVPVDRQGGGMRDIGHIDRLIDERWNLLVFPQGTRSRAGEAARLRSGAAVLAAGHGVALLPIHVRGTGTAMPPGQAWPRRRLWRRRHPVDVVFGQPIRPADGESGQAVIGRVHAFFAEQGADSLAPR